MGQEGGKKEMRNTHEIAESHGGSVYDFGVGVREKLASERGQRELQDLSGHGVPLQ